MSILAYLRSLAQRFLRRPDLEDELEAELASHVEHRADDLVRGGMSRAAAERQARVEFGGHSRFKEESRDAVAGSAAEAVWRDVRVSIRQLRKAPAFTVAAVVTLSMAIGANATVFSVFNGLLLRPLNLPREESLYNVERASDKSWSESYPPTSTCATEPAASTASRESIPRKHRSRQAIGPTGRGLTR
jgi:hypothetical protein